MLKVRPIELRDANAFVALHHRHHKPVQGHRFSTSAWVRPFGPASDAPWREHVLCGVAICGRPVSSGVNPLEVLEVTRLCTDGTRNACSLLYAACARAARALGYAKIQTYVLREEHATSLRASGWTFEGMSRSRGHWHGRADLQPAHLRDNKQRWSKELRDER